MLVWLRLYLQLSAAVLYHATDHVAMLAPQVSACPADSTTHLVGARAFVCTSRLFHATAILDWLPRARVLAVLPMVPTALFLDRHWLRHALRRQVPPCESRWGSCPEVLILSRFGCTPSGVWGSHPSPRLRAQGLGVCAWKLGNWKVGLD